MHTLAGINHAHLQLLSMGPRYVTCLAYNTQQSLHYSCFVHSNNPTPKSNHNGELPVPTLLFFFLCQFQTINGSCQKVAEYMSGSGLGQPAKVNLGVV